MHSYIASFKTKAPQPLSAETKAWLDWAKRKADWYDPFIESPDELLTEVDQNELELPKRSTGFWGNY